jgi:hypothetical protein
MRVGRYKEVKKPGENEINWVGESVSLRNKGQNERTYCDGKQDQIVVEWSENTRVHQERSDCTLHEMFVAELESRLAR